MATVIKTVWNNTWLPPTTPNMVNQIKLGECGKVHEIAYHPFLNDRPTHTTHIYLILSMPDNSLLFSTALITYWKDWLIVFPTSLSIININHNSVFILIKRWDSVQRNHHHTTHCFSILASAHQHQNYLGFMKIETPGPHPREIEENTEWERAGVRERAFEMISPIGYKLTLLENKSPWFMKLLSAPKYIGYIEVMLEVTPDPKVLSIELGR